MQRIDYTFGHAGAGGRPRNSRNWSQLPGLGRVPELPATVLGPASDDSRWTFQPQVRLLSTLARTNRYAGLTSRVSDLPTNS